MTVIEFGMDGASVIFLTYNPPTFCAKNGEREAEQGVPDNVLQVRMYAVACPG